MHISSVKPWGLITAYLLSSAIHNHIAAADDTFPQQVQISLVFPRNETYDISSGVLPLIFAISNTHYANSLRPSIGIRVFNETDPNPKTPSYELGSMNLLDLEQPWNIPMSTTHSDDDTTYLHYPALNVTGREGTWLFGYYIDVTGVVPGRTTLNSQESHILTSSGSIVFTTTRNGAAGAVSSLDADGLVPGTANTSCAAVPFSQSITLTDVVQNQTCEGRTPSSLDDPSLPPIFHCPVLANDTQIVVADYGHKPLPASVNMTTTGSGCAPTIDAAVASMIVSKSANDMACWGPNANASVQATACPPPPYRANMTNMASLPMAAHISVPGLAAVMVVVVGITTGALLL